MERSTTDFNILLKQWNMYYFIIKWQGLVHYTILKQPIPKVWELAMRCHETQERDRWIQDFRLQFTRGLVYRSVSWMAARSVDPWNLGQRKGAYKVVQTKVTSFKLIFAFLKLISRCQAYSCHWGYQSPVVKLHIITLMVLLRVYWESKKVGAATRATQGQLWQ